MYLYLQYLFHYNILLFLRAMGTVLLARELTCQKNRPCGMGAALVFMTMLGGLGPPTSVYETYALPAATASTVVSRPSDRPTHHFFIGGE